MFRCIGIPGAKSIKLEANDLHRLYTLLLKIRSVLYWSDKRFRKAARSTFQRICKINKELGKPKLEDYEIYTSLAPCLMCLGKIYWSGIRNVYYILSRNDVDINLSYEGDHDFDEIVKKLNRKIGFIQDKTYFEEALQIYKSWNPSN